MATRARQLIWAIGVCAAILAASARPAQAQDERKVGLVMAYPTSVGVIWQVSKRLALRPDATGSWSWSEDSEPSSGLSSIGFAQSTRFHSFGVGFSALVTVAQWDRLRAYVVPRVSYSRSVSSGELTLSGLPAGLPATLFPPKTTETRGSNANYSAAFGAQYGLVDRFAIFGEIGVGYSWSRTQLPAAGNTTSYTFETLGTQVIFGLPDATPSASEAPRRHSLGLRSGVGLIFFF